MPRQLFGTDGVRGRAGSFLSAELAVALARATVELGPELHPQVLIVRDTRESGDMLEAAIAAGVTAGRRLTVLLGGVLPTPAAPLLVRRHGLDLAAVISASHNPYEDNGIKFFAGDGFKLSDETEAAIENQMDSFARQSERLGRVRALHGAHEDYLRELHTRFQDLDLSGRRVLLDCANGATLPGRARDLPPSRRRGRRDCRPARRPQHQRWGWVHAHRAADRDDGRGRP